MRYTLGALILWLLVMPASAELMTPEAVEAEIRHTLQDFDSLGKKSFKTKWPGGQDKEVYEVEKSGKRSYTKFFPAGNIAITYQKAASGAVIYEKKFGDGKDAIIIKKDERIVDYTSYWPNGQKKGKYQKNFQTKDRFYTAHDADGRQVYPKAK